MEKPDKEDGVDRKPPNWDSLMVDPEVGRLSGKRAFTMVTKSDGLMTRYGLTSAVSRREVMDLAGSSFELCLADLDVLKRPMMFSMWTLISGGGGAPVCFLYIVSSGQSARAFKLTKSGQQPFSRLLEPPLSGFSVWHTRRCGTRSSYHEIPDGQWHSKGSPGRAIWRR